MRRRPAAPLATKLASRLRSAALLSTLLVSACGPSRNQVSTHSTGRVVTEHARPTSPLSYAAQSCRVGGVALRLHVLAPTGTPPVQLRVLPNPTARRDARCRHGYGGSDLLHTPVDALGIEPLGAVNGWFFSRLADGSSRSNGFLWTQLAAGPRRLSPLASTEDPDMHGDRLVVADSRGLHELRLATGPCTQGECRARILVDASDASVAAHADALGEPLDDDALGSAITEIFPSATMAMQLVAALPDDVVAADAPAAQRVADGWRCPASRDAPDGWKCERQAVSVLCGRADGRISLVGVEPARYSEIVTGLRAGGACTTECAQLYLLDGGYSPQVATHDDEGWQMRWAFFAEGTPPEGCAEYRAVEHWLVLGNRR